LQFIWKASKPIYMPPVNHILRNVPADSRRTFQRAFMVTELLASVAFSRNNIIKGAIATGAIKDGSGSGCYVERMLENCPVIKLYCSEKGTVGRMEALVGKCSSIADEMVYQKNSNSKNYLGTVDDQRMVQEFGDIFGDIHIGTGIVSTGNRVTALELIRWRTTLLGANGQLEIEKQKRLAIINKNLPIANLIPVDAISSVAQLPAHAIDEGSNLQPIPVFQRQGKKCGNINCPDHARYCASTCRILWRKCPKNCNKCESGKGGSVHVCSNNACQLVLAAHILA
jgi:hypothetical protein